MCSKLPCILKFRFLKLTFWFHLVYFSYFFLKGGDTMFFSILLSILLAFFTLTVVLCLFYFLQESIEGENKLLTCIVVGIIALIFSIQFGCFLYDKFSGEYIPAWISLFFFLFNLFSLGMVAIMGFVFIVIAGNKSKSKIYTIPTCIFIFLIVPYFIYHSFSTFFLKVNDLAIKSNFTFFECAMFVLIIFLGIFIVFIIPIVEKKYLENKN